MSRTEISGTGMAYFTLGRGLRGRKRVMPKTAYRLPNCAETAGGSRPNLLLTMKTILAPVDFSGATETVLAAAGTLAKALNGRVVLMHVVRPPAMINEYAPEIERLTELAEKTAVEQMDHWRADLRGRGIETDVVHAVGSPVAKILDEANQLSADMIVMGSHGHGALYGLLVGSTAGGILKKATCPVMIVPPAERPHAAVPAEAVAGHAR